MVLRISGRGLVNKKRIPMRVQKKFVMYKKQKGKRKKDRKGRHVIVKKYNSFVKSKRIF